MHTKKLINFGSPGFWALGLEPYRVSIKCHRAYLQIPHYKFVPPGCWAVVHMDHTVLDVTMVDPAPGRRKIRQQEKFAARMQRETRFNPMLQSRSLGASTASVESQRHPLSPRLFP
jgi:hypothetical protein